MVTYVAASFYSMHVLSIRTTLRLVLDRCVLSCVHQALLQNNAVTSAALSKVKISKLKIKLIQQKHLLFIILN